MKRIVLVILCLLLSACGNPDQAIQTAIAQTQAVWTSTPTFTRTSVPSLTPRPTNTLKPTKTPTSTRTPTSAFSVEELTAFPLQTQTVQAGQLATQTAEAFARLTEPKGDGFYLVNVDIAPGLWRSTGTGDNCYYEITNRTGGIIANHFGMAGVTAYIHPGAFQVQFERCGIWIYLSAS